MIKENVNIDMDRERKIYNINTFRQIYKEEVRDRERDRRERKNERYFIICRNIVDKNIINALKMQNNFCVISNCKFIKHYNSNYWVFTFAPYLVFPYPYL